MVAAEALQRNANNAEIEWVRKLLTWRTQPDGARELTAEEAALVDAMGMGGPSVLLLGFAIENAAKGILSSSGTKTENHAKTGLLRIAEALHSHDLLSLVQACDEPLDEAESQALSELRDWVEWRGRYPIPISYVGYAGVAYGQVQNSKPVYTAGRKILQRLLERLMRAPMSNGD